MKLFVIIASFVIFATARQGFYGDQEWGYTEVRKDSYMFWWLYYTTAPGDATDKPLLLWLQGGPGASSTGIGNFEEFGQLDLDLQPRNSTWINNYNVMFIDNPVGTGFSYLGSKGALATDNHQIAADLLTMITDFYTQFPKFKGTPLYIFSESYGGKMAAEFALVLNQAIKDNKIKANLKGVAMGDSWISPIDALLTWAPYLLNVGMVNQKGYEAILSSAKEAQKAVENKDWDEATSYFDSIESLVEEYTSGVDFYNILTKINAGYKNKKTANKKRYPMLPGGIKPGFDIYYIMNNKVKQTLDLPADVNWAYQSDAVFSALSTDFMKPVTNIVEELLNTTNLQVIVYNGELDLIVDTPATMTWVNKLQWKNQSDWLNADRVALVSQGYIEGFTQKGGNFEMYWVSRAGHMVPADNPNGMDAVLRSVTGNQARK